MKYKIWKFSIVLVLLFLGQKSFAQANRNGLLQPFAIKITNGYSFSEEISKVQVVGGNVALGNSPMVGVSFAWYYDKNWSVALSASSGKYSIAMRDGDYTNIDLYRYDVNLGSVWIAPVNLSLRYHLPIEGKVLPFISIGGSYVFFKENDYGWAADKVNYQNQVGIQLGAGADIYITKHWFISGEIQKFITNNSRVTIDFSRSIEWQLQAQLRPELINAMIGVGYRF